MQKLAPAPVPGIDSLTGLIKRLDREPWREGFEDLLDLHLGEACQEHELDFDDLAELLGAATFVSLWGCVFEDFLTRTCGPDDINIVDDYLKRRGWKETATARRYMQALRDSTMSLYEVSSIVPGQSFLARDLLRGGEPVLVSERAATRSLASWDRIAARLVELNGKTILGAGVLAFTHETAEVVIRAFKTMMGRAKRELGKLAKEAEFAGASAPRGKIEADDVLAIAAPLFSAVWLADALARIIDPALPTLVNGDGDELAFCTVRFALAPGTAADAVRAGLRSIEALEEDSEQGWTWVGPALPACGREEQVIDITIEGATVLATIELADDAVLLTANSPARAERGQALLAGALGALVQAPVTEMRTLEEMMAPDAFPEPPDELPPEIRTGIVHEAMSRHYRAVLDQPVAMLGNLTPRAAARTKRGRVKIVAWLKYMENQSARRPDPDDPTGCYDLGWLWAELGVADLRR